MSEKKPRPIRCGTARCKAAPKWTCQFTGGLTILACADHLDHTTTAVGGFVRALPYTPPPPPPANEKAT